MLENDFCFSSLRGSCQEKQDIGNSGKTVDRYSVVQLSLSDPFVTTHHRRRKGSVVSRLSTLVCSH